jgi:hypothetical protein
MQVETTLLHKVISLSLFGIFLYTSTYLANGVTYVSAANDNPSITIAFVGNTSPRWGIDSVGVIGITKNADLGDYIVNVDWGDGTQSRGIPISSDNGKWGPVYHTYSSSAIKSNPHKLTALLRTKHDLKTDEAYNNDDPLIHSEVYAVEVQRHGTLLSIDLPNSNRITNKNDGFLLATLVDKENISKGISKSLVQLVDATNERKIMGVTNDSGKAKIPVQQYLIKSDSMNEGEGWRNVRLKYPGDFKYEGSYAVLDTGRIQGINDNGIRVSNFLNIFLKIISESIQTFIIGLSIGAVVWLTFNGIVRRRITAKINK